MRAVFTGQDGSMGFKKGKEYQIRTKVENGYLWVVELTTEKSCPYERLEPLLDNWRLAMANNEPIEWDDF